MRRVLVLCALLAAGSALAADRHVYLDTNFDGRLNDCPNPAHNTKGIAGNTDELSYCTTSSPHKFICDAGSGCKSWTTTTAACGAPNVANVTNGVTVDVDGDALIETIYGHPQACGWAMATSDSCEVHAGLYARSGAYADSNALDSGTAAAAGCDKNNCWYASFILPGPASGAYGISTAPGYIRGAVMNGSTDTWDADGDKVPDCNGNSGGAVCWGVCTGGTAIAQLCRVDGDCAASTCNHAGYSTEPLSYYPTMSGDRNQNGVFDTTSGNDADNTGTFTGTGGAFNGDAYYGFIEGCAATTTAAYSWCGTSHSDNPWIDTDANGTFDTRGNVGNRNPDFLTIKDLEFVGYNGGHAGVSGGVRAYEGTMTIDGDGSTDGIVVDHLFAHGGDYTLQASQENFWGMFADSHNGGCSAWTEIKNSYLEQTNEKLVDDDCGVRNECGCPKLFHDNYVTRVINSARSSGRSLIVYFYYKSIDTFAGGTKTKVHRIFNNVFNQVAQAGGSSKLMDLQAFGCAMGWTGDVSGVGGSCTGVAHGELWVYGNLFRNLTTSKMDRLWLGSCGIGTAGGKLYFFGNTFDGTFNSNTDGIYQSCFGTTEALVVEKNNAYWSGASNINTHDNLGTVIRRGDSDTPPNEICSIADTNCFTPASTTETSWFLTPSTSSTSWAADFKAEPAGPLDEKGTCNPDGDGTPGVDYYGTGTQVTSWYDLAGQLVDCSGSLQDAGAVQSGPDTGGGGGSSTQTVRGVIRGAKKP
jgi:hypothetical protein